MCPEKVASVFFRYSVMISTTFPQLTRLKGLVKAVFVCNGTLKIDAIMKV